MSVCRTVVELCTFTFVLSSEVLWVLNNYDVRPSRAVRKAIFSIQLWRPTRQGRQSTQRQHQDPGQRPFCTAARRPEPGLAIGCVNVRSVGNKAATFQRTFIDECFDVFVVTETWHERTGSTTLQRVGLVPPGFLCIDAARPIPPDVSTGWLKKSKLLYCVNSLLFFEPPCIPTPLTLRTMAALPSSTATVLGFIN